MYKRIFLSKKTVYAAMLCIAIFTLCEFATGVLAGGMEEFDYFDLAVRLFLSVFLFNGYRRHSLLALQGSCSGLLICMLYSQASFLLNNLFALSTDQFIILGFWGSFFLAGEMMLLILEAILTVNHFVLFILKKQSFPLLSVNHALTFIMLAFLLLQAFVVTQISMAWQDLAYYALFNLGLIAEFILIACAELMLAPDAEEGRE